ncbi:hypothetical protein G6F35_018230 [Rhizopus arrhizus]|nr:hypothetical protein G6F31_018389 [Rhizopus arrhizus]KAG1166372.1 hypothetical protein G6F35_018230 [Rhizopus arrhizus]
MAVVVAAVVVASGAVVMAMIMIVDCRLGRRSGRGLGGRSCGGLGGALGCGVAGGGLGARLGGFGGAHAMDSLARRSRKNRRSRSPQGSASTPPVTEV